MNEIIKRMNEINARKVELRAMLEGTGEVDLDKVTTELRELDTEYKKLEQRKQTIEGINAGTIPATEIPNPVTARSADNFDQEKEYRNAWLKTLQGKALTENEQRAYSTAANSALPAIPESTANEIIKKMYEVAPILQKCKIKVDYLKILCYY